MARVVGSFEFGGGSVVEPRQQQWRQSLVLSSLAAAVSLEVNDDNDDSCAIFEKGSVIFLCEYGVCFSVLNMASCKSQASFLIMFSWLLWRALLNFNNDNGDCCLVF